MLYLEYRTGTGMKVRIPMKDCRYESLYRERAIENGINGIEKDLNAKCCSDTEESTCPISRD